MRPTGSDDAESAAWIRNRSLHGGADRVPVDAAGELWLCGKHLVGADHQRVRATLDLGLVVCLTEAHELADRYPSYVAWLGSDPAALWHPIHDLHAPPIDEGLGLARTISEALDAGSNVLVHCGAGIGRAGTVAVLVLLDRGRGLADATRTVADARPMAGPEAGAQTELLVAAAERLGRR